MKAIPLTRGMVAKVDDADYEWLSQHKWYASVRGYAVQRDGTRMHRVLLPGVPEVDHVNQDKLDNQRHNLRPATHQQNTANTRRRKDNTSGFKGVIWYNRDRCWLAVITILGRRKHLGYFEVAKDAALAYDEAARKEFGEFACVNFPQ